VAFNWLCENLDNPVVSTPFSVGSGGGDDKASPGNISMLMDMGLTDEQARRALNKCDDNVERALDYHFNHPEETDDVPDASDAAREPEELEVGTPQYRLHGFVTHLGASPLSGHYVAHIRKGAEWVLYNDDKVAASTDPPFGKAYLYFYEQVN
jgi:ubiquitin carboxyl-terminal hydrolase 5/13